MKTAVMNIATGVLACAVFLNYLILTVTMASNSVRFSLIAVPIAVMALTVIPCVLLVLFGSKVPKTAYVLQIVFVAGMAVYLVSFIASCIYTLHGVNCTSIPKRCDAVIVFGAKVNGTEPSKALKERLDAALDVYEKHPDTLFIVTGGQGSDEKITEALCMERYLISHKVPRENIIKEEQATDTVSNILNSKAILEEKGIYDGVVCISSEYHVKRIEKICADNGMSVSTYGSHTRPTIKLWANLVREYMSNIKYFLKQ